MLMKINLANQEKEMYPCFYQFSFSKAWKYILLFLVHQYKKTCVLVDIQQNHLVQNM